MFLENGCKQVNKSVVTLIWAVSVQNDQGSTDKSSMKLFYRSMINVVVTLIFLETCEFAIRVKATGKWSLIA